jgi:hypothetical protein
MYDPFREDPFCRHVDEKTSLINSESRISHPCARSATLMFLPCSCKEPISTVELWFGGNDAPGEAAAVQKLHPRRFQCLADCSTLIRLHGLALFEPKYGAATDAARGREVV